MALPSSRSVTKGRLGGKPFMYNPSGFTNTISVEYQGLKAPGISYPILGYSGGETETIELELYLNGIGSGYEKGSRYVRDWISHLESFIPQRGGRNFNPPKTLEFAFGWFVRDTRIEEMIPEYKDFTPDLQPLEVTIRLKLLVV